MTALRWLRRELWQEFLDARAMILSRTMWLLAGFCLAATLFKCGAEDDLERQVAARLAVRDADLRRAAADCEKWGMVIDYLHTHKCVRTTLPFLKEQTK